MKLKPLEVLALVWLLTRSRTQSLPQGSPNWTPQPNPDPDLNVPVIPVPPNPLRRGP